MINLKQPGFRSFITYIFSFIFLTLFIYLGIPFFYNYENFKSDIEKKLFYNFGINLNFPVKAKYNFFPSPRLNLEEVEILSFPDSSHKIGFAKRAILKIPFKQLASLKKMDFYSVELINAVINVKTSEISDFKNYLNNLSHEKPIQLKKSKINLLNKTDLLFSINVKKLNISSKGSINKANLKGKIFDTKIKIDYQNKTVENTPVTNITMGFPEIGLNIKSSINVDKENADIHHGRTNISFPNNKLYFDYILKKNNIFISSSSLINNYFKGQMLGDIALSPFSIFDLNLNIDLLKFKNILNSDFVRDDKFLSKFIPFNKKINGKLSINIDEIKSSSNIINSGDVNLEFRNGVLKIQNINLNINRIGNLNLVGRVVQQKVKKQFIFNSNINIENSKIFFSRFLIPMRKRKELKPVNISGKFDLESYLISLDRIYFEDGSKQIEMDKNELLRLKEKINEIVSQNSLDNILRYSNFRNIIQSFFD